VEGWGGFVLKKKLKYVKIALKDWHLTQSHNLPGKILSLKTQIDVLEARGEVNDLFEEDMADLHDMSTDLHSLSMANASISWQQSRLLWLREGDENSKYFHAIMSSRRRSNTISFISVEGNVVEGVSEVREAVFSHFQHHYQALDMNRPMVDGMNFRKLSVLKGNALICLFTEAEVKAAVWDCDGYKSPGPDGNPLGFIKDFWQDLKGDILRFVLEFHRNGRFSKGINSTFIALISKIDNPHRLNDFHTIALVGCLYKILVKLLAKRLCNVMETVISDTQSTFVKDRQILDGILVANEVVDEAGKLKKDLLLFKVDFEKAFDSVDWGYLDDVMGKLAFPTLWRKWMKECVTTATASVLVNGSPIEEFQMKRGLRQGDPLSPFLFLLAAEGLNVLMTSAVNLNLFTGYSIGSHTPPLCFPICNSWMTRFC